MPEKLSAYWLALCIGCLASNAAAQERTWTDVDGRTMRAEFIREIDGEVSFLQSGKLITLPLTRLSEADRQHIRQIEAAQINPDARPAEKPTEPSPFIERGNSAVFEEMRAREERRRLEQAEQTTTVPQPAANETADVTIPEPVVKNEAAVVSDSQPEATSPPSPASDAEPSAAGPEPAGAGRWLALCPAEYRPILVGLIVFVGVVGTVAVLVGLGAAFGSPRRGIGAPKKI